MVDAKELTPKVRQKLQATASEHAGNGMDHGLPPEVRFLRSVTRLLHGRNLHPESGGDSNELAVFILSPGKPSVDFDVPRIPIVSPKLSFNGSVWWTNEAATYGYSKTVTGADSEVFDQVEQWGFGLAPAVVFDPASEGEEIRYFPEGLSAEPLDARPLVATDAAAEAVEAGMEALMLGVFTRPGLAERSASPWQDAAKNHVRTDAESIMQGHVQTALSFHFIHCNVQTEMNVHHGRLDVLLEEYIDAIDAWRVHCILELKILRSFNENGNPVGESVNRSAITKGTLQAFKYRTDRNASWAALYCFDLRASDIGDHATFAHIEERASNWSIALRRWFLSSSAETARVIGAVSA